MSKGSLLLLPNVLGDINDRNQVFPVSIDDAMKEIDGLIAENAQKGRSFLNHFQLKKRPYDLPLAIFNKKTPSSDLDFLLEPMIEGECWGLISDAGLPCIADPGAKLVARARYHGIDVKAYVGPSSIFLALMLSGLPGQRFCFHGYLSKHPQERTKQIKNMQYESFNDKYTQIIMEAPYRNNYLLKDLLANLNDNTKLCVAWDLTLLSQEVLTFSVKRWKKEQLPDLSKKPALFLF